MFLGLLISRFKEESSNLSLGLPDMSERWIINSQVALKKLRKISEAGEKDRLEHLKSIKTSLALIGRSLSGWYSWISNPSIMANFTKEEMREMENKLIKFAESFIEFDIAITKKGLEKGLKAKKAMNKNVRFVV
jgi:hypothetical protein